MEYVISGSARTARPSEKGGHSRGRGFAVAVGPEAASVSSAGRHRHRSGWIQVVLADYDDGDSECGAVGVGLVGEAVSTAQLALPRKPFPRRPI